MPNDSQDKFKVKSFYLCELKITNHCFSSVRILRKDLKLILYFDPSKYIFNQYLLMLYCQKKWQAFVFLKNFWSFYQESKNHQSVFMPLPLIFSIPCSQFFSCHPEKQSHFQGSPFFPCMSTLFTHSLILSIYIYWVSTLPDRVLGTEHNSGQVPLKQTS